MKVTNENYINTDELIFNFLGNSIKFISSLIIKPKLNTFGSLLLLVVSTSPELVISLGQHIIFLYGLRFKTLSIGCINHILIGRYYSINCVELSQRPFKYKHKGDGIIFILTNQLNINTVEINY
jgi:hypothetical protein